MTNTALVSIVVPSFNQAGYLPTALDSVMFQDYPNIEIIICNHGSTDDTHQVIKCWLKDVESKEVSTLRYWENVGENGRYIYNHESRYPRNRSITVIESERNIGGTSSYNEGFKAARGEYCTYLVGDDYFFPNAIKEMVDCIQNTAADFVYADMFLVDDNGRILQHLKKPEYSFRECFADWYQIGVCKLYRKVLHKEVGRYDPSYRNANDYDMYLRFAMAGVKFQHLKKTLYCVRSHNAKDESEPASWRNNGYGNLLKESVTCAKRAREFSNIASGSSV